MRPGAIDQVLKPLGDLQQQLAKMAASANKAGAATDPGSADPAIALQTEAMRQPQPLAALAHLDRGERARAARRRREGADHRRRSRPAAGSAALCPQVVTGKYPFTPGASDKDATLDEFGRLFGPAACSTRSSTRS